MGYLLDTNIVSELIKNPFGPLAQRIRRMDEMELCTSIIVAAELRYGVAKRGSEELSLQVAKVLGKLAILAFEAPADEVYGEIRAHLERAGTLIGPNDLLIAAQAVSLDHTVVTDNLREFSRVPGLRCENWLR